MAKTKVMVIDDSALIRQMLSNIINAEPDMEVVATAGDPYIARDKIKKFNPDVLTLDVEMPRMDGLAFLRNVMRLRPMPVIMISALTQKGADTTLQALEYGALDFVCKPQLDISQTFETYSEEIVGKLRMAARTQVKPLTKYKPPTPSSINVPPKYTADAIISNSPTRKIQFLKTTDKIIAVGASTGGTEAIKLLLMHMPAHAPGMVISQHIPATFSSSFAKRMNQLSPMTVAEAEDGKAILPGHVYIAPGNFHLLVERDGARYVCRLNEGTPVNRHRPSVDVLFRSVAQNVGPNSVGVILTGMGDDGATGMKEMHEVGAFTIAQDEHTSVVWGMPGEAVKKGGVDKVIPLQEIPHQLMKLFDRRPTT
ncbi:chemotaxis response regulator protein-glutamate methylesterase [Candidatus Albibeggiatoa sp. nov. NOAA]|uniref:protein-glutamate methylesterase/protein-glutamine glutaminase n=1 Tax=Candidatus Albibeggiatoa sp. nov. NOAA TaxID=3162724 RepID=UPI0032FD590E|nr:chemotaxis response regulator protein-glutamate methylesterase [Thiotrichaceae bacterium]